MQSSLKLNKNSLHEKTMNRIDIILTLFGLGRFNQTLSTIFMGTTMLSFFFFISFIILTLPVEMTVTSLFPKLSFLFFALSMVYIWCDLKKKSEVLMEMYEEIIRFETKHCSATCKFALSLLLFFVLFIATYVSMILMSIYDQNFNRVLEPIGIRLTFKEHTYVSGVFTSGFIYGVQFISFEISFKYYKVLKHCNRFINMFVPFNPNFVIRHQIDSVIHDFDETRQKFTENDWSAQQIDLRIDVYR